MNSGMDFEVLILGSSSATPMFGRHPSAQLLRIKNQLVLMDCGEGTQMRLNKHGIKYNKINSIFISHLHGDHYLGLMGLLSSMHLMGRKKKLFLFGPKGLDEILKVQLQFSDTTLTYELDFQEVDTDRSSLVFQNQCFTVHSIPLDHRIPCCGYLFSERASSPKINLEKVEKIGMPLSFYKLVKSRQNYVDPQGKVFPWQDLTIPPREGLTYAYCSDTLDSGRYHEYIKNVDLLYHEATFLDDLRDRAELTYHTTALQAGEIARKVGAKALLIGHFSARYRDLNPLLAEAKTVFPQTKLALEDVCYTVGTAEETS